MPTLPAIRPRGLRPRINQLAAPDGSLVRATNVVMPESDSIEPRRGQRLESNSFGAGSDRARAMAFFRSGKVALYGTTLAYSTTVDGAWTNLSGSFTEPDSSLLRMKFVELALNLYFTTSLGLYQMESLSSAPVAAGVPRARDLYAGHVTAAGSYLAADKAVAYSVLWGIKDANGNVKLGAPSQTIVLATGALSVAIGALVRTGGTTVTVTYTRRLNDYLFPKFAVGDVVTLVTGEANFAAGAKTITAIGTGTFQYAEAGANVSSTAAQSFTLPSRGVQLAVYLPSGISSSSGHFCRIYRSLTVPGASITPPLDLYQVGEQKPTGGDDIAGYLVFQDDTPDTMLLGAPPLPTSPNAGDGALSANLRPPLAKDIFEFDGRLWFLNITEKHRFFLNMLGVGSPNGIQNNDTIGIAGRTYTFKTAPAAATDVLLFTGGSASQNIEDTARSLVGLVNSDTSNTTVYLYYVSGPDDAPGRILIEERSIGGAAFVMVASRGTSWYPALPTSGSTITSDNARNAAGLAYSKTGQPEAVPITNRMSDLPRGKTAIRAVPLKDKVFIFIDGVGIWVLTGPAPYKTERFDTTAKLLASDCVEQHSNQLLALTDQGLAAISDGGVRILSADGLEQDLLAIVAGIGSADLRAYAFAVSYEADRQFQLWLPLTSADNVNRQAFVYNSLRDAWTRWTGYRTCGGINPADGKLYLGDGQTNKFRVERKDFATSDYADEALSVTVNSGAADGLSAVLASATGVAAGDVLTLGTPATSWLVTAVNSNTLTLAPGTAGQVPTGAASVLKAYACDVKFAPPRSAVPAVANQYREATFHFAFFYLYSMAAYFDSELSTSETTGKTLSAATYDHPGGVEVATSIDETTNSAANERVEVPRGNQHATQLRAGVRITEALARWRLNGYSPTFTSLSEKNGR